QRATQGLANYILSKKSKKGVVIGYDSRKNSALFAQEAALVLAANGIEVFLFEQMRPTPLVSFAVRHKNAIAGIMITASHNPPQYNGYKVYWEHGGQVLPPHDEGIIDEVSRVERVHRVESSTLIHQMGEEVDEAYIEAISKLSLHPENRICGGELSIVYTSLHGAGISVVPKVLKSWGFDTLNLVEKQVIPDGSFPTVSRPNPEEPAALELGIEELKRVQGDLLIATDPDADRIGIATLEHGKPVYFNGNEVACMVLEHLCQSMQGKMPPKPMFVKTIVTTELFATIAKHYGASCLDVLTGFKYIGEKIAQWEDESKRLTSTHHYIFGGEESYGYLPGTHARDKDAVVMAAVISQMALQCKLQDKTLSDFLFEIYMKYGVYANATKSFEFEGKEGQEKMEQMMQHLREAPPKKIGHVDVRVMEDYWTHQMKNLETGKTAPLTLPKSNVILFRLVDGSKLVVRPSGTEPKIKFYCEVVDPHFHPDRHSVQKSLEKCYRQIDEKIEQLYRLGAA
nr:phospho-sugar mutase [Chlamydiota bacterium]